MFPIAQRPHVEMGASRTSSPASCAGASLPVPAGAQVIRGDTAAIGCVTTGVYANEVLTIRLEPTDPQPAPLRARAPG